MAPSTVLPTSFARAVDQLKAVRPRSEIVIEDLPAPQRLAPYAYALGAAVLRQDDEVATGRLILLHDPAGHDAWSGTTRLVSYVTADLEAELAVDPLLPSVAWSWLVEALDSREAAHTAIGGTVTQTTSSRFGALADTPVAADVEIRASWTPLGGDLTSHAEAWYTLLASAAGLPPPGITALGERFGPAPT